MVTTNLSPQKEYAKSSGNIDTIFVKDNQQIKSNMPLAVIENTADYKDVYFLKSIVDTIQLNNKGFEFPFDSLPILFLGDLESDYALFENSYIQYQLNKQLQPFSSETLANHISKSELLNRLGNLKSQKQLNQSELTFQKNDLERHKLLFEKGIISAQDYEAKQIAYTQAQRNFENMDASISTIREAISNANKTSVNTSINKTRETISLLKNFKNRRNSIFFKCLV